MSEFFQTLPAVFTALWSFGRGWAGVAISVGSAAMVVGFCLGARALRVKAGWLSAILGMMAATVAAFWAFGILPSAWIYFADAQRDLLEGTIIPAELGIGSAVMSADFFLVFRDSVVMIETIVAMTLFGVAALRVQKLLPKGLAEGEEPRAQSGGYK